MAILDSRIRTATATACQVVTALGVLALGGPLAHAQAPTQPTAAAQAATTSSVRFEVASIKRNLQGEAERAALPAFATPFPGRSQTLPGGRLRGPNMSVREIIRDAYGYRNRPNGEIVGVLPDWIDKERYDVEARAAREFPASTTMGIPPDAQAALRVLLAERFNLKAHIEVQRRPIYELVMNRADRRLGPNLTPSKGGCRSAFQREPVNTEEVVVRIRKGGRTALVNYRNRVTEVNVPASDEIPTWE